MHIRIKETYSGYPVWGADAVVHIPQNGENKPELTKRGLARETYMNGFVYQNLKEDLVNAPSKVFDKLQESIAVRRAVDDYLYKMGHKVNVSEQKSELLVYVDRYNKAHWAYKISFLVPSYKEGVPPSRPVYIIDALNFEIYLKWNNIQTAYSPGGGYGGNPKIGKLVYDGLMGNLARLNVTRDNYTQICRLETADVLIKNQQTGQIINYKCPVANPNHNNVYWDGSLDAAHGGYSPGNDALFGAQSVRQMYADWYHIPVLTNPDGSPMLLRMFVHDKYEGDNAHWDGNQNIMVFGDGLDYFYPLTSLGVTGHEVSHGFTQQHSDLIYEGMSGGMNESFSDMAAQAIEVYVHGLGKNTWKIGAEIFKQDDMALRYMDRPSRDCGWNIPGNNCSIDSANQYYEYLDPHFSSGVYNRFFYLLSTSPGWDVKKAFDIMVQANRFYWIPASTYDSAGCGVLQAAADLKMDLTAIKTAFDRVRVDYTEAGNCRISL